MFNKNKRFCDFDFLKCEYDEVCKELEEKDSKIKEIVTKLNDYKVKCDSFEKDNIQLKRELSRSNNTVENDTIINRLLTEALGNKVSRGHMILWDETIPRSLTVISNGKTINCDSDKIDSIYFNWNRGEFPTLEYTR